MYGPIGYYVDPDTAYCSDCYTEEDWQGFSEWEEPITILSGSETDSPTHCARCEQVIPENLTEHGIRYVAESVLPAIVEGINGEEHGRGRLCILKQWWEQYLEDTVSDLINDWPDDDEFSPRNREEQKNGR